MSQRTNKVFKDMPNYTFMNRTTPLKNNKQYIKDMDMGFNAEDVMKPHLERTFGALTKLGKWSPFDYENAEYVIELKTRRCNHDSFDRDGGLMFNYSKIEKIENYGSKKVVFAFNCLDGLYYWDYDATNFTTAIGGRRDRGCIEMREMAKVLSSDMKEIEKPTICLLD